MRVNYLKLRKFLFFLVNLVNSPMKNSGIF